MWSSRPSPQGWKPVQAKLDRWGTIRIVSTGRGTSASICDAGGQNGVVVAEIPAKKMGRPSKGKPWVEAGVSKASWYRQQKSKGEV